MKAVFIDYTGTMVREESQFLRELLTCACGQSDFSDPRLLTRWVWEQIKEMEQESYGPAYRTEDEIVELILQRMEKEYHLRADLAQLHALWQQHWIHAPLFEDVADFFRSCPLPIYIITNDGASYVEASMKEKGLQPAGIVSAEEVRAYKPHPEIFARALERAGCDAHEAIHIGDSVVSDVAGARAAGISPVLIDRTGKAAAGDLPVIHRLQEAIELLRGME